MNSSNTSAEGEILDDAQAAAFLVTTQRTLRLWRKQGLPYCRISQKSIRYRRRDLLQWLDRRRVAIVS